jgi:hypothetical protein
MAMNWKSPWKKVGAGALAMMMVGAFTPATAFAATNSSSTSMSPYMVTSVGVNGKVVESMPVWMKSGMTKLPLWYVMRALHQAGIMSSWNGMAWKITTPKSMTIHPVMLSSSSGKAEIYINGKSIGMVESTVAKDPFSGHMTTFLPQSVVTQVLTAIGVDTGMKNGMWWLKTMDKSTTTSTTTSTSTTLATVATIDANKTGQTLQGAPGAMSKSDEATFVLTALTANGKPAANEPVHVFIGPMKPLSGIPPKDWYESGSKGASAYVASLSKMTNAKGQATLVLYGEPADSMDMVGVQIGNLSTYNPTAMKAMGALDAWWTSTTSKPTAPIGDYVKVWPFATTVDSSSKINYTIEVESPSGPVKGAHVAIGSMMMGKSSMGMGTMNGSSMSSTSSMNSMMSGKMTTVTTNSKGMAMYTVQVPKGAKMLPVRVVVTQPTNSSRITGGMNLLWLAGMN